MLSALVPKRARTKGIPKYPEFEDPAIKLIILVVGLFKIFLKKEILKIKFIKVEMNKNQNRI
jgi:hypothetical protein